MSAMAILGQRRAPRAWLNGFCVVSIAVFSATGATGDDDGRTSPMLEIEALQTALAFFPILPWGPTHGWDDHVDPEQDLAGMAACNFTIGGFARAADLPMCEKLGLKAIIYPDQATGRIDRSEWNKLSDEEIDSRIKTLVEACGDSDAILGYYIIDEPGALLFPALGKAVAAVKKYAPGKLAYINLYPNYATIGAPDKSQLDTDSYTEYLERFVKEARPQVLSYDNYMVQYSMDMKEDAPAAKYYTNLMEVRRVALEYGIPFWNIVSSNQIRPHTTVPSPANLLFQVYTTLAAGGRGVSWYTYYARGYGYAPIDESGNKTVTWQYLQAANRQVKTIGPMMNGLESTGAFFTSPAPVDGLPLLPGELVAAVECDAPVMVGEFAAQDGARYAMVVNLGLDDSAKLVITLADSYECVQIASPEDGSWAPMDVEKGLWLAAGQGALARLR